MLRNTSTTESPRRNIFEMKRSFCRSVGSTHMHRLLAFALRDLSPHLLDVFEHHIRVAVKCLDTGEQLFVVAQRDEHLRVVAHSLLQHRQRALRNLVLFQFANLALVEVRARDVDVLTGLAQRRTS